MARKKKNDINYADFYTFYREKELEDKLHDLYLDCQKDIENDLNYFFGRFDAKNKKWLKKLKNGEITEAEYKRWLEGQIFQGKMWGERKEFIANQLYDFNKLAYEYINEVSPDIFATNFNYMAYTLENRAKVDLSFYVYDSTAVKKLVFEDIEVIPYKKLDKAKDIRWNFQNIKREVAKSIIKGESVDKLAKVLSKEVTNRNEKQMRKHAITALNSARNQGRMARIQESINMGIDTRKKWVATLDAKTRIAHAYLDQQVVDYDEYFEVEGMKIRFPGDPHAHPSLVYNCRCRLDGEVVKYPSTFNIRRDNETGELIENMNYREWYKYKTGNNLPAYRRPRKRKRR